MCGLEKSPVLKVADAMMKAEIKSKPIIKPCKTENAELVKSEVKEASARHPNDAISHSSC